MIFQLLLLGSLVSLQWAALPCDPTSGRFRDAPFCDERLSIDARVGDYITHISQQDKLGQFVNKAGAMPSVDMPAYQWWSEALHGVAYSPGVHFGGDIPASTSFPQVCLTAATFNRTLFNAIGSVISTEARAMNNDGRAGLTFWTPNINIFHDPRWGRGQETPGECPFLSAEYVASYLPGLQADPQRLDRLKISSCCKHYAAYDLEDWHNVDRHHFNAVVTAQDEADTFFPAFESCVVRGKASGFMCSYNAVNGIPSCADYSILNGRIRGDWNFDGYVTSDCGAVNDILNNHKYTNNSDATIADTLRAGMDIDCGNFFTTHLEPALKDGAITMTDIDNALFNLYKVQFRLGMFDNPANIPWKQYTAKNVNTAYAQNLAWEAAAQGVVLLKNDKNNLPYDKTKLQNLAVVGPNGNGTKVLQGNYYGSAPFIVSITEGLERAGFTVTYVEGCAIDSTDKSGFQDAVDAVNKADAVVMVMGLDQTQEREGHDRDILSFPGVQSEFIETIASAANGKPTTLLMINGGPVDISAPKANANVQSILWAGYPGQSGGDAIGKIIEGAWSPGGRLPHTVYPADYVNQVSMFDMNMRPGPNDPGRTYRFFTGTPVYEFGSGMSYTTFSFSGLDSSETQLSAALINEDLTVWKNNRGNAPVLAVVNATVKNTGGRGSAYTGLLFAKPPGAGQNGLPIKELVQFDRDFVLPTNSQVTLRFPLTAFSFAAADTKGNFNAVSGTWTLQMEDQTITVTVA